MEQGETIIKQARSVIDHLEMEKRTQICRECPVHLFGIDLFGMINNWTNCLFSTCPNSKNYQCHESENGKEDA